VGNKSITVDMSVNANFFFMRMKYYD
jgi:hypothetical protein